VVAFLKWGQTRFFVREGVSGDEEKKVDPTLGLGRSG